LHVSPFEAACWPNGCSADILAISTSTETLGTADFTQQRTVLRKNTFDKLHKVHLEGKEEPSTAAPLHSRLGNHGEENPVIE